MTKIIPKKILLQNEKIEILKNLKILYSKEYSDVEISSFIWESIWYVWLLRRNQMEFSISLKKAKIINSKIKNLLTKI